MPTYQLKCVECGHVFLDVHKVSEPHPPCTKCNSKAEVYMTKPPAAVVTGERRAMQEERKLIKALK